jgi:acetyl-CoA synthetase
MDRTTGEVAYRAARDILVRHRDDWDAAVAAFRWPDIADRFNWALDWLDPVAAGNLRTALRIIGEDGTDRSYSFAEMAARSDRLATSLAADGVAPGDQVDKFAEIPGDFDRIALGDAPAPWRPYRLADTVAPPSRPGAQTGADDSMLIYFTSGTTSRPKLVQHTHRSYPVGHLSTMYFLGLRPGDVHLNISSPGWAKHAWSSFFARWIAESTILV